MSDNLAAFYSRMREVLEGKALEKGYGRQEDGGLLHEFVKTFFEGHSLGEVVYKAVRFRARHDPEDLVKIAAWAFLEWRSCGHEGGGAPEVWKTSNKGEWPVDPPWSGVGVESPLFRRGTIDKVMATVGSRAISSMSMRPNVMIADVVRLAGLVIEEAGEGMKQALDMTRARIVLGREDIERLIDEWTDTATMAVVAIAVLREREHGTIGEHMKADINMGKKA